MRAGNSLIAEGMRIARPLSRGCLVARCVAALALASSACTPSASDELDGPMTWSADTLVMRPALLRAPADSVDRGELIGQPIAVRVAGGHTFIADRTVDRIAVVDSFARVQHWIGTRGRGPGELFGVSHLEVRDDRLLVAEALNGRVSAFSFDGRFVRAFASPFAAGALGASTHAMVAIARSSTHYAAQLDSVGEPVAALPRPRLSRHDASDRWRLLLGHDLVAADSSRLWVLDQMDGRICSYARPDAPPHCRALPASLRRRLREYRDQRVARLEEAIHQHVRAAPLVKDMVRFGCWLALLLPLPDLPVVLVDVTDGTVTPVLPRSAEAPGWTRTATAFAWDGQGFLLVGDEGIGRLYLERSHSNAGE